MKIVYILYNPTTNLSKIGITDNIKRRLRQLECSSGTKIELFYHTELLNKAKTIEKSLHLYFNSYRKEGEYFDIHPSLIKEKLLFIIENLKIVFNQSL